MKQLATILCILAVAAIGKIDAQSITINQRSHLVMNGAVSLVVNNAAFINNGNFSEGKSTVILSGNTDTTQSYVNGNTTTFYNLRSNKSALGVALKAHAKVRNVLGVDGGTLYTDSNLTLLSDANLTARVDIIPSGANVIGKANVERYIPGKRAWRLLTAPVTSSNTFYKSWQNNGVYAPGKGMWISGPNPTGAGGNGLDASPQNNISVKGFNFSTQAFTNLTNTHVPISSGNSGSADNNGYFVFVRGDRTYSNFSTVNCNTTTITSIGKLQIGTQTFQVSKDSAKYSMIGNPYASPINFNDVVRNNVVKRLFVYDPRLGDIGIWVMLDDVDGDGIFTKSIGGSDMSEYIQSSQAFLVQTSGNVASASLTFNESCKSSVLNSRAFRPTGVNKLETIRSTISLLGDDGTTVLMDGAISEFGEMFSARTNLEDASKIINTYENISILRNGLSFTAERRPPLSVSDTIYLKIWKTTQRKYRLSFSATNINKPGMQGYLEDAYLRTSTPISLTGTNDYDFSINADAASANMERFRIVFRQATLLPVTITSVKAYESNDNIAVDWKVENEINIVKYEIEKSLNGTSFTAVGTQVVKGNNNSSNTYSWIDQNVSAGTNYYRIKVFDASGEVKYSSIVKVNIDEVKSGITIYPNPVKGSAFNVQFKQQASGKYQLRLLNNIGQTLQVSTVNVSSNNVIESVKLKSDLTAGVYQLEIVMPDNQKQVQKIIAE